MKEAMDSNHIRLVRDPLCVSCDGLVTTPGCIPASLPVTAETDSSTPHNHDLVQRAVNRK